MTHRHAGLLALLALAGCSSREACSFDASLTPVESTSSRGDRVFSFGGEREEIDVELALSGLPELWAPEGAIQGGRLSVRLAFAYDGVPVDGTVEMPSIGVSFEHAEGSGSSSPYATNLSVDGFTFTTCAAEEDRGCCEFGAKSCTIRDTVRLERLQGEPFPPLGVTWELDASASINDCPLGESNPELDLSVLP